MRSRSGAVSMPSEVGVTMRMGTWVHVELPLRRNVRAEATLVHRRVLKSLTGIFW